MVALVWQWADAFRRRGTIIRNVTAHAFFLFQMRMSNANDSGRGFLRLFVFFWSTANGGWGATSVVVATFAQSPFLTGMNGTRWHLFSMTQT